MSEEIVLICETTGDCTCGAPASTPRGMHHDYCGVRGHTYPPASDGVTP